MIVYNNPFKYSIYQIESVYFQCFTLLSLKKILLNRIYSFDLREQI
jgi:hypothetical protein